MYVCVRACPCCGMSVLKLKVEEGNVGQDVDCEFMNEFITNKGTTID